MSATNSGRVLKYKPQMLKEWHLVTSYTLPWHAGCWTVFTCIQQQ